MVGTSNATVPVTVPTEYTCLKLSFDNLEEDAKRCLLLASLFPEDSEVSVTALMRLATGSQLLECKSVRTMIGILKSSSMLLQGKDDQHFKMHDVIRDEARSIAINDYAYSFTRCGSLLPDNSALYETLSVLHLEVDKNDFRFPDDLVCPNVHTLWLRSTACDDELIASPLGWMPKVAWAGPENTFQAWDLSRMFVNLKFLVLVKCNWEPPFSLKALDTLRTLILDRCDIGQTDATFFPENLETLCIWNCNLPLLLDLPNLQHLLTLEIQHWPNSPLLVASNVISSLIRLEELHILNVFCIIDKTALSNLAEYEGSLDDLSDDDFTISVLDEICKLTRLASLQISLHSSEPFQRTNILFRNLLEFNIWVGKTGNLTYTDDHPASSVSKIIELCNYQSEGLDSVVESAEEVTMHSSHVDMSSILSANKEAFADLRSLSIEKCNKMEHLARISRHEIQHSRQPLTCFSKLVSLKITNCSAMEYLFCSSVAKCLLQLQELRLKDCPGMEAIVMDEGTSDADIINFPKLKLLKLHDVPRLKSFCRGKTPRMDNSGNKWVQSQPLFDGMVKFPCLEKLKLMGLKYITDIWGKHCYNDNISCFSQIKTISIGFCNQLNVGIPHAMLNRLQNLEDLKIFSCESLVSEVGTCGSSTVICPLLALRTLTLYSLPYLTITGLNSREISGATTLYPNLEYLRIEACGLTRVFLPSIARDLIHLKQMSVAESDSVRGIITGRADEEELSDNIIFPELIKLRLNELENLKSFWCNPSGEANTYKVEFPKLVDYELRIQDPDHSEPKELGMMIPPVN
ncbi:disease resistance protein At4g27190 [Daucus carota subsp. sativus]|uniref:disease resistance protein At4g27190 n=1 Tax=Daucus carota subsp. sativus TaxID=79200 RepID=UPI0007B1C755|nr:PREDICTED: disease resistance protein At4g27190-like [Daucus carota subsp. sativus]